MFTVNSLSSPLVSYTNVFNNDAQPSTSSSNQIAANIQRIQNVPDKPKTLKNMIPDTIFIDNIAPYLSIEDMENFNKAEIYSKIDPYYQCYKELRKWNRIFLKGDGEKRGTALRRIRYCIKRQNQTLNLRNLKLTSLPNLKSATFITSLLYDGNSSQPIIDSIERRSENPLTFNLKKSSFLPKNISTIVIDTIKNTDLMLEQRSPHGYMPKYNFSIYNHYKAERYDKIFFEKCWDYRNNKSEDFFMASFF